MHHVAGMKVSNFRSCVDVELELGAFTPLVGPNNAGKSTLLSALSWALSPDTLGVGDFFDAAKAVVVEVEVAGLTAAIIGALTAEQQKRISPFVTNERLRVRRNCPKPGTTGAKTEVEVRNPAVVDDKAAGAWTANPNGIWAAISALFPEPIRIGAMEDSAEDASKSKNTTTLGKLIGEITADVVAQVAAPFQKSIGDIADRLSADGTKRPQSMIDFDTEASTAVGHFFQGVQVKLHIPSPDLKDLFKAGTIVTYDGGVRRDFTALGHGAQRSIQMALVRVLADRKQGAKGGGPTTRLLLIDEPELFLHPSAVYSLRDALRTLSTAGYQVVLATHSPMLIEEAVAASTVIVGKDVSRGTFVRPTVRSAVSTVINEAPHQASLVFSLTYSSELLFANSVVVTEGKTERRVFPDLFRASTGASLRTKGVAVLDIGGVLNARKTRDVLSVLGLRSKVVADLDFVFRGAQSAGWLTSGDTDIATCIARLGALAPVHGCKLDGTGLPVKGGAIKASKMFEILAGDSAAAAAIQSLHIKLLAHNVWIWTRGAIEPHLGIVSKDEATWTKLVADLNAGGLTAVTDQASIEACMSWLATP